MSNFFEHAVSISLLFGGAMAVALAFRFLGIRCAVVTAVGVLGAFLYQRGRISGREEIQHEVDEATKKAVSRKKGLADETHRLSDTELDRDNTHWVRK